MNGLELGLLGGGISALATSIGAILILAKNTKFGKFLENINMDFAIGLMLSASAFSLIVPAYESQSFVQSVELNVFLVTLAVITGVVFIRITGKLLDQVLSTKIGNLDNKKAALFVIAMMIHNLPEGIAAGSSMTLPGAQGGSLLGGIALQNLPEGFTTAISFLALGLSPVVAFLGALLTAGVELFGGIFGGYLSVKINGILPFLMAFAGGAMMNVVFAELIEKIRKENALFMIKPRFLSGVTMVLLMKYI